MMKLITAVLLTSLMQVSAATYGQFITLKERNVTLERMFKEIRQQSGYDVLLSTNKIKSTTTINASFNRATIEEVMAKIIADRDLTYTIEDKTILISLKERSILDKVVDFFVAVRVTGKVRDKSGSVLPGVSVREKGAANAVSTTSSGDYSISVKEGATLVFSYIGYKNVEVEIGSRTTINVTLEEDAAQLKEVNVVSTGYQQLDRKLFTGAATQLKVSEVERLGVSDISRMLEGQVAGVTLQNVSGTFGAAPKIRVRGATSLSGDNKPLWVVDGIILEDVVNISNEALSSGDANTLLGSSVAGLNADDIESFNILKDAAATAMYGARAMNGVIVVTTKKGRQTEGAPKISYTGNFTTYSKPSYEGTDILNSDEQMSVLIEYFNKGAYQIPGSSSGQDGGIFYKMYNQLYNYDPATKTFALKYDKASVSNFLNRYANANTDWFDILYKNSLKQEHSLSVTSGTEKFQTYASTSYLNDKGQTIGSNVDRFTANFRVNFAPSKKLSFELLTTGSVRNQRTPSGNSDRQSDPVYGSYYREFDVNPYNYARNTSRLITPYDENGNLEYFVRNYAPFNILNELENNYTTLQMLDIKVQGGVKYKIIPALTYSINAAYRFSKSERQSYVLEQSNQALAFRSGGNATRDGDNQYLYIDSANPTGLPTSVLPTGGFYNTAGDNLTNYYFRHDLVYDKNWNDKHLLNVFGSMEVRSIDRQNQYFNGIGYQYENGGLVNPSYLYFKEAGEAGKAYFGMGKNYERYVAYMLRAAYSYEGRYSFNATTRYDGSNKMGRSRNARWLPTWNVSGSWNADQESFWPKNDIVTYAVLRGSYGLTASIGNATNSLPVFYDQISRRQLLKDQEVQTYISTLQNTQLTWEKSYDANIGLDLRFFKNKVNLSVDVYNRTIHDLLGSLNTSGIGGEFTKTANYAAMNSRGIEFTVSGSPINSGDFKWSTNFNFAFNRTKITELDALPNIWRAVSATGGAVLGYPQRGLFSVQFAGLNPQYGYPTFYGVDGKATTNIGLQGDEIEILKYEGPTDPTTTGGFFNQFRYKNFSLSALFKFSAGNALRLAPAIAASYSDMTTLSRDVLNRWIMPGDERITNIPALLDPVTAANILTSSGATTNASYPYNLYNYSTERVVSGDYLKLSRITASYDIPKKITSKFRMSNASLIAACDNVAVLYADKRLNGEDPEFFSTGGVALPVPTQFTLSLRIGF
ncbi:SusC/RagA family TonB-linked outer membrane protein [Pedobacter sp. BMA]|uniref:SusC/RagA family TonB-linked outer membrane protein n=1 Tax=Pedobacter sp. BMA TaxID=1663685 RepID=UPI00069E9230|nr:SusC/RagA family TonB-linked outer membrane protein [Pedobacter sp. BMA]